MQPFFWPPKVFFTKKKLWEIDNHKAELDFIDFCKMSYLRPCNRVSVQGVKSLGGHFACLCRGFEFYEVKKKNFVIIFQKENGNTFTLFIIFIVKSFKKSKIAQIYYYDPPIFRNKCAITPKWYNCQDFSLMQQIRIRAKYTS